MFAMPIAQINIYFSSLGSWQCAILVYFFTLYLNKICKAFIPLLG
jgi:hypothetical protein